MSDIQHQFYIYIYIHIKLIMQLNELYRKREDFRVSIRKQQINAFIKYKRKTFELLHSTYTQSKLYQIYEIIINQENFQMKHLLQQLCQELSKEIEPQFRQLQLYFLKFVLSIQDQQNIEYIIQIIGLICYDITQIDQYSSQILNIIMQNMTKTEPRIRQKCLLTLTNFSATDNQLTLSVLYKQEAIFKQLIYILEQYSLSNAEKLNIAGFFMNMTLSARIELSNNIQIIYLISIQNFEQQIIQKCTSICKLLLNKFGDNLLKYSQEFQKTIQNLLNYALINNHRPFILELLHKIILYDNSNFNKFLIQNNLIDLIISSTENSNPSIKIQSYKIIKLLINPKFNHYLTQRSFENRLNIIIKGFYEDQSLKPYILQILIQSIPNQGIILTLFQQQVFEDLLVNFSTELQNKENIQKMLLLIQNLIIQYKDIPKHLLISMKQIAEKSFYLKDQMISLCASQLLNILNEQ